MHELILLLLNEVQCLIRRFGFKWGKILFWCLWVRALFSVEHLHESMNSSKIIMPVILKYLFNTRNYLSFISAYTAEEALVIRLP